MQMRMDLLIFTGLIRIRLRKISVSFHLRDVWFEEWNLYTIIGEEKMKSFVRIVCIKISLYFLIHY